MQWDTSELVAQRLVVGGSQPMPVTISGYSNLSAAAFRYHAPFDTAIPADSFIIRGVGSLAVESSPDNAPGEVEVRIGLMGDQGFQVVLGTLAPGESKTFAFDRPGISTVTGEPIGEWNPVLGFSLFVPEDEIYREFTCTDARAVFTLSDVDPTEPDVPSCFWTDLQNATQECSA